MMTAVPIDKLAVDVRDLERDIEMLTAERKVLLAEIARRYEAEIAILYKAAGKQHGKVTVPGLIRFGIEVDTRQTVTWDQAKLREAADTFKPEDAAQIFKVELSVPEKIYNALLDGDVKKALTDARTTKLSAPSIKVVFPTGDKK